MSAYLVSPEHIAEICKWAFHPQRDCHDYNMATKTKILGASDYISRQREAADILACANLDSIAARYGENSGMYDDTFVDQVLGEVKRPNVNTYLSPADIYNMAKCLNYQSCEVDDWDQKNAFWLIQAIQDEAGYHMAKQLAKVSWSYSWENWKENNPVTSSAPVSLSALARGSA